MYIYLFIYLLSVLIYPFMIAYWIFPTLNSVYIKINKDIQNLTLMQIKKTKGIENNKTE